MTRDDITRMAREAGFHGWYYDPERDYHFGCIKKLATLVAAAERNKLAAWMMAQGYATGHGDSMEDLLKELTWQIHEDRARNESQ